MLSQCFVGIVNLSEANKDQISHLSSRGRQAGGGERSLALHLSPAVRHLDGHLVQVSLAVQVGVQRSAGLCQTGL